MTHDEHTYSGFWSYFVYVTNLSGFCSLQVIQVTFALIENYTFSTSADRDCQCYRTSQREGKDRMALLCTEVRTEIFDKMQYCVTNALKFTPVEVKWKEAFI